MTKLGVSYFPPLVIRDANFEIEPEKGWLAFQGYYDEQLAKTNGSFLK